jgi:hypothetical protein
MVVPALPVCCTVSAGTSSSAAGSGTLTLNWPVVTTGPATFYNVQRATNATFTRGLQTTLNDPTNSLVTTGMNPGTTYYFQVAAGNVVGTSAYSSPAFSVVVPNAPNAPTTSAVTDTTLTLNFGATPPAGSTYSVLQNGVVIASGLTGATYNVTGLTGNTTYSFSVAAVYTSGTSAGFTATSTARTVTTAISAPTGVTGVPGTLGGTITAGLSWTGVTGAASYQVRWSNSSAMTGTTTSTATSGQQINVGAPARTVYMQVRARFANGTSSVWSTTVPVQAQ